MAAQKDRSPYAAYLDRIIEKYTALPREDPDFVDYADRPELPTRRRRPPRRRRRCSSRRAR